METGSSFTRSEKAGNCGRGGFRIHSNATHHVMAGWADFHGTFGDVHVGEFLELVIHAGKLFLHVLGGLVGDVKVRAAVFCAAAFADFRVDRASNDVAGGELHALRVVFFHEALAEFIAKDAAFAANGFGDENSLYARRPDHAGRMELDEFHVHELRACLIGEGHTIGGVFPGI